MDWGYVCTLPLPQVGPVDSVDCLIITKATVSAAVLKGQQCAVPRLQAKQLARQETVYWKGGLAWLLDCSALDAALSLPPSEHCTPVCRCCL